jgi:hypothetical protein
VRFPSEADPGDAGWHIEASYEVDGRWHGSHLDVPPILAPGGGGLDWSEAAQQAAAASAHRRTAYATGRAGDVFLCHHFLVHAASWPHRGRLPRMIAQPAVALHGQFPLDAEAWPAPVEQAILAGLPDRLCDG